MLFEQIGPAQERAVGGVAPAEHDVVAAAGAGVAAVDHELVGAEAGESRFFVEAARDRHGLAPVRRRMDIDLDDAGIGRDLDDVEARIGRRRIAFDMHRQSRARPPSLRPRRAVRDSPPAARSAA